MDNDRANHWYSFLEEESLSPGGLLCFYDVEKSQEVAHCCTLLVEGLPAFLDDGWGDGDALD
jgi:hypothetical protein